MIANIRAGRSLSRKAVLLLEVIENTELLAKINQGLAAIKADGTYAQVYAKTFGGTPAAAAAPAPAASK
jgi:ABC-type amino acid transport substrate-binding protein